MELCGDFLAEFSGEGLIHFTFVERTDNPRQMDIGIGDGHGFVKADFEGGEWQSEMV